MEVKMKRRLFSFILLILVVLGQHYEAIAQQNIDMISVTGGTVALGDSAFSYLDTVKNFSISKYRVTNGQFAKFLNDYESDTVKSGEYSGKSMVEEFGQGLIKQKDKYSAQFSYQNCPVVMVTWYGAKEFCRYYGYSLPTETQWEFAARGGNNNIDYRYHGNNKNDLEEWETGEPQAKMPDLPSDPQLRAISEKLRAALPQFLPPSGYPNVFALSAEHPANNRAVGWRGPNGLGVFFDIPSGILDWCENGIKAEKFKKTRSGSWSHSYGDRIICGAIWELSGGELSIGYCDTHDESGEKYIGFRCVK
jgi:hypothetical protein